MSWFLLLHFDLCCAPASEKHDVTRIDYAAEICAGRSNCTHFTLSTGTARKANDVVLVSARLVVIVAGLEGQTANSANTLRLCSGILLARSTNVVGVGMPQETRNLFIMQAGLQPQELIYNLRPLSALALPILMNPFLRPALMSNLMDPPSLIDGARWLCNVCTIWEPDALRGRLRPAM